MSLCIYCKVHETWNPPCRAQGLQRESSGHRPPPYLCSHRWHRDEELGIASSGFDCRQRQQPNISEVVHPAFSHNRHRVHRQAARFLSQEPPAHLANHPLPLPEPAASVRQSPHTPFPAWMSERFRASYSAAAAYLHQLPCFQLALHKPLRLPAFCSERQSA